MARSLKSKRRKQNKRELRKRYKPRYDAQLKAIVANFQEQTDEVMEDTDQPDVVGYQVKMLKRPNNETPEPVVVINMMEEDVVESGEMPVKGSEDKVKIPKVDIKKVAKFMSQRKYRTYKVKVKRDKKRIAHQKPGEKKKRRIKW